MNDEEQNLSEIADQLKRLRPASASIDAKELFYQAGLNACQAEMSQRRRIRFGPLIAAGLLAAAVTAPASYRVGRTAALRGQPATETVIADVDTSTAGPPAVQQVTDTELAAEVDDAVRRPKRSGLLARWTDPYGAFVESARRDKELGTTLAVFHSSLVARHEWSQLPIDFPFDSALAQDPGGSGADVGSRAGVQTPLAVRDLSQFAHSFEAAPR